MYKRQDVILPFLEWVIPLGGLYMLLVFFMFTGASNAVNLTDGMDGLAAGCSFQMCIRDRHWQCVGQKLGHDPLRSGLSLFVQRRDCEHHYEFN